MNRDSIASYKDTCFTGFSGTGLDKKDGFITGKVRDIFSLTDRLVICTTDRISAFDRILSVIPCKGELLNRLSLFWFDNTSDIIENHIADRLTARTVAVKRCEVLPVEVIVRGYLTGSAWRDYNSGNSVSGIELPSGMRMNQRFGSPLLTPSTKAEQGEHDMPISPDEIVSRGLVDKDVWAEVERTALALFSRGTEILAERGLILVDTKYEFGLLDGRLVIVDEVHTPDSSRFWYADTYESLYAEGLDQRKLDKEYLRQWLMEKGFMGNGDSPEIPDDVRTEVAWRYIQAYETITGKSFEPESLPAEREIEAISGYLNA